MTAPVFIGDEVTAAGYRLAGARVIIPATGHVAQALADAAASELVIITAACAAELPAEDLDVAVRKADPLLLLVPDSAGAVLPQDLGSAAERALGIEL